jgi:hypothetical protein
MSDTLRDEETHTPIARPQATPEPGCLPVSTTIAWRPASEVPPVLPNNAREYLVWRRFETQAGGHVTVADYLNACDWIDDDGDHIGDEDGRVTGWHFAGPANGFDEYYMPRQDRRPCQAENRRGDGRKRSAARGHLEPDGMVQIP